MPPSISGKNDIFNFITRGVTNDHGELEWYGMLVKTDDTEGYNPFGGTGAFVPPTDPDDIACDPANEGSCCLGSDCYEMDECQCEGFGGTFFLNSLCDDVDCG